MLNNILSLPGIKKVVILVKCPKCKKDFYTDGINLRIPHGLKKPIPFTCPNCKEEVIPKRIK